MKMLLAVGVFLISNLVNANDGFYCLKSNNSKYILMVDYNFRFVMYYPIKKNIKIKYIKKKLFDDNGKSPDYLLYFHEVISGKKVGLYEFEYQGSNLYRAQYKSIKNGNSVLFIRDNNIYEQDEHLKSVCY